jgi:hypothetical protein
MNSIDASLIEKHGGDSSLPAVVPNSKSLNEEIVGEDEINPIAGFAGIVGQSSALREVLQQVEMVAGTDSSVLLLGETGTGKELIARAIHDRSRRKSRALVKVNCAAIPVGLIESELFGHERGAFTGAITQKIGRFELADHGSLFLDEIGDIPLELQTKLLRVLQERELERLGSTMTRKVDVSRGGRHSPSSGGYDPRKSVPQRPLLSPQRFPNLHSSVARTPGRHSAASAAFCPRVRPPHEQEDQSKFFRNHGGAGSLSLARKHSRIAKCDRTFCRDSS